jgi:NAD(P)-dependent dehydrogenase (short-subunit alcohol dehydrogenase family)
MTVRIRMPSHLISNAQPSSSTGSVPVTAFIGLSSSSFTDYNTRMGDSLAGLAGLITGGGSGIGLACARHLVRDGASVTLMGRSKDRLQAAADAVATDVSGDAKVQIVAGDASSEEDMATAVESASTVTGALQLVVASAGTGTMGPVVATSMSEWERVLNVNLTGTFLTIKHAAPALARGGGGSIVAISSIAGPLTHPYMAPYSVSKAGIETLVRNAADELGRAGVRVNAVRPGLVPTELADPLVSDERVRADYLAQMPLHRLGTVDDIAAGVRYLLGPESSWVTGQILAIDGGHTLRRGPDIEHWARAMYGDAVVDVAAESG